MLVNDVHARWCFLAEASHHGARGAQSTICIRHKPAAAAAANSLPRPLCIGLGKHASCVITVTGMRCAAAFRNFLMHTSFAHLSLHPALSGLTTASWHRKTVFHPTCPGPPCTCPKHTISPQTVAQLGAIAQPRDSFKGLLCAHEHNRRKFV